MRLEEKTHIFFDLDGTLTDPKEGITKSVQYALRSFGIEVENPDDLTCFIGPPLRRTFQDKFGLSQAEAETAVAKYRERFADIGIFENALYPGLREGLRALCERGKTLAVATSKPWVYAERILRHFEVDACFAFVSGSELNGSREDKGEVIAYALSHFYRNDGLRGADAVVMVGDRLHDIAGARRNGVESIGVSFGYGGRRELLEAGADWIVDTVPELFGLWA